MSEWKPLNVSGRKDDRRVLKSIEQDGGLWLVGLAGREEKDWTQLGYVWNEGYLREDRKGLPYRACLDWDSCVPVEVIGESPTFMGAVRLLREYRAKGKLGVAADVRDAAFEFIRSIARDSRDTIWQPDWHALQAKAAGIYSRIVHEILIA